MSESEIKAEFLPPSSNARRAGVLAVSGISGLLASACCIGPLALASIGLGSLAGSMVVVFGPLRPVFVAIALVALGFAGWKIYRRPVAPYESGAACDRPYADRRYKIMFWIIALIVLALITFPYYVVLLY